jgi:hypothetical protein
MDGQGFDALARAVAQRPESNRRSFLRAALGAVAGLAAGGAIHKTSARNAEAADFCKAVFGPGPERGQCIADAAQGHGLYYECNGDSSAVCWIEGVPTCTCGDSCTPSVTCESVGAVCGEIVDDCGTTVPCGSCADGQTCNDQNQCVCIPTDSCATYGYTCGSITNSCGVVEQCGTCTGADTCGGGGETNVCGCTSTTCAAEGIACGPLFDGCSTTLDCGPCACSACTPTGAACTDHDQCCSGECGYDGVCTTGEVACRPTGDTCSDDYGEGCCVGTCSSGCCTCLETFAVCGGNDDLCCEGSFCSQFTNACCKSTDVACSSDAECCGGHCNGGRCDQGAAGTVCRNAGDCINRCDDAGLCTCSPDGDCYTDADCCDDHACTGPARYDFAGTCQPPV